MIDYQLSDTQIDQISDHRYGIYLNRKLSTKLLPPTANKNTRNSLFDPEQLLPEAATSSFL